MTRGRPARGRGDPRQGQDGPAVAGGGAGGPRAGGGRRASRSSASRRAGPAPARRRRRGRAPGAIARTSTADRRAKPASPRTARPPSTIRRMGLSSTRPRRHHVPPRSRMDRYRPTGRAGSTPSGPGFEMRAIDHEDRGGGRGHHRGLERPRRGDGPAAGPGRPEGGADRPPRSTGSSRWPEAIRAEGGTAVVEVADAGDPDATRSALEAIARRLGPIDLLVANAGVGESTPAVRVLGRGLRADGPGQPDRARRTRSRPSCRR